jgi:nucleotide-binding universal stress UspA family protein
MYSHILVPTDGSELSIKAAHEAIELGKLCRAKMTAIMVLPTYRQMDQDGFGVPRVNIVRERWEEQMIERAKKVLDGICADAKKSGVECQSLHVFGDAPYEAIIEAAEKHGCDVIAMGSHGHGGVKQFFVGSETTRVLSHTKIPVMVYR